MNGGHKAEFGLTTSDNLNIISSRVLGWIFALSA